MAWESDTIQHIKFARTFFCFENIFQQKRNKYCTQNCTRVTHKYFSEIISLARNRVLFHEKFESLTYTLWGYTPENVWGINFGQNHTQ